MLFRFLFRRQLQKYESQIESIKLSQERLRSEIEYRDRQILDLQRTRVALKDEIENIKDNVQIAQLVRHILSVVEPGEVHYTEQDLKEGEQHFLSDVNEISKNHAFSIVIGRLANEEFERTFEQEVTSSRYGMLQMTKGERIAFGQGAVHGIALVKEEVDVLASKYRELVSGKGDMSPDEKFSAL